MVVMVVMVAAMVVTSSDGVPFSSVYPFGGKGHSLHSGGYSGDGCGRQR